LREKKILAPFSAAKPREKAPRPLGIQNAQNCSSRKLSFISDFLQSIVVQMAILAVGEAGALHGHHGALWGCQLASGSVTSFVEYQ
jgi:hypothetical protein